MARSVVFETKGKLDLRSITVFGLHAKPDSKSPIGYFGTGMKYALAVLARERINVTIQIGKTKWTVNADSTTFRGKDFKAVVLNRHGVLGLKKSVTLPFTTELGKNWKLWQAFRELHSNTIDEAGTTSVHETNTLTEPGSNTTHIIVESEDFAQEYYLREKTFLPDALRQQESTDSVQVFKVPSEHIYYRGIRVMDLKKPSQFTYNILEQVVLTEDRTAKDSFTVNNTIARFIAKDCRDEEVMDSVIMPREGKYEDQISYMLDIQMPSQEFLDRTEHHLQIPKHVDQVNAYATKLVRTYRPQPKVPIQIDEWSQILIDAIEAGNWDIVEQQIDLDRPRMVKIIKEASLLRTQDSDDIPF